MNDLYAEVLIKKQATAMDRLKKTGLIMLLALSVLISLFFDFRFLLAVAVLGVATYFLLPTFDLEYEYLLVNRELDIDKIYSRSKRKEAAQFQLEEMELFAPLNSRRMEHYNSNSRLKIRDYSSGDDGAGIYAMIIRDGQEACKVLLEPDAQMLDILCKSFPNKVFVD